MRSIRVETSSATILLTEAPEKKVKDRKSGEVATDGPVGNQLHRQGVRSRSSEGAWSSKTHYLFPDGPDCPLLKDFQSALGRLDSAMVIV